MSAADATAEPHGPVPPRRGPGRMALKVLGWTAGVLAVLAGLVVIAALLLDTAPGRRFLASELPSLKVSGLTLRVGRIEGSIYGRMVLHDLSVRDAKGLVATSPAVVLDWAPGALLERHVLVNELSSPQVNLLRKPELAPSTGKSHMPSLTYTVRRLSVSDLALAPAVTGERRDLAITAAADMGHGRVRLNAQARARPVAGQPGGDVVAARLDADPDADRLQLDVHVFGPKDGVIDRLLKLGAPIAVEVHGHGDWRDWRGRAQAAVGGDSVLDAALTARDGRFTATGSARPGRIVKSIARLTAPAVRFDLAAGFQGPRVTVNGQLASGQFDARIAGAVDRKRKLLDKVRIEATLLDPSALSPQLSGRDVRLSLDADGPFARPLVNYDLTARSLGYGKIAAENVQAHGRSALATDGTVTIPVSLTAARITGLSKSAGPLTDVALNGSVAIGRNGAVRGDLRLRSHDLQAVVSLHGSQRNRSYSGTLTAKAGADAIGRLGLTGALGGATDLSADFSSTPATPVQVSNLKLAAPLVRVVQGEASYRANGQVAAKLAAVSAKYGPVGLTVGGTRQAIQAHLVAPGPGLPGGVSQLKADVSPAPGGYRITATAVSPYGPVAVNALARTKGGPLSITLARAAVGDLNLSGTVTRSAAGPFAGVLTLVGDGLDGTLALSAQGKVQAADVRLRAANARLPLSPPVTVRSGDIRARLILYPEGPAITGQASLQGVQRGALSLTRANGRLTYRNGSGEARLEMAGDSGAPFKLAAQVGISPSQIRVTGGGEVSDVSLRLAGPAVATRTDGTWRLAPTTVLTSGGRIVLSGTYGAGASLAAELQSVDLRLVRALKPGLGLSGQASGQATFDLPKGGAPTGKLALQLTGLTHTGASTVSRPIDVNLLGDLGAAGGQASAVVRQRGAVIGRVQAHVSMPATGSISDKLRAAQVNGGIRYNGPVDALVGLAGIPGQQLTGPVAIGADISGPLQHPQMRGVLYGRNLDYQNAKYGTHITKVDLDGRFVGPRFELVKLTGDTPGGGHVSASGYAEASSAAGWPIDLTVKLDRAQIAKSDQLGARLSGALSITNDRQKGGLVSGDLTLDNARYEVERPGAAVAAELKGVHWKGQPLKTAQTNAAAGPPSRWRLNVKIHAPNQIQVNGMGLESEWKADLRVLGDINSPRVVGDVRSVRGSFSFGGRKLTLEDSTIHFDGSSPPDPTLAISASATVNSVTATVNVAGSAKHPEISFSSSPALPEDEVLSQLLFGGSSAQLSPLQAVQLAASLNALRGGGGGLGVLGKLSRGAGLENLRFEGANAETGQGPSVGAGKYITNNIYVDLLVDARGYTATQVEVALTPALSLLSQVSAFGSTSASIRYTHRY